MTDKQLIKEEIERRIVQAKEFAERAKGANDDSSKLSWDFVATQNKSLLQFIDSLQEQPISEDWEEAAKQHSKQTFNGILIEDNIDAFKAGAEWQRQKDLEDSLKSDMTMPNKFYEKGRFDMREEMMKDAVEGEVVYKIGNAVIAPTDVRYKVMSDRVYIPNVKLGDKVKIIIVKEEQQ